MKEIDKLLITLFTLFYAAIGFSIWYTILYLIPFKLKDFKNKDFGKLWLKLNFIDRFSVVFTASSFFLACIIIFSFQIAFCLGTDSEFINYVLSSIVKHQSSRFCFLNLIVYGIILGLLTAIIYKLKEIAGWKFLLPIFFTAIGAWIIILIHFKYELIKNGF